MSRATLLFVLVTSLSRAAAGQSVELAPDDRWEAQWGPDWDSGIWSRPSRLGLDLAVGRRGLWDFARQTRQSETFVLAHLVLPFSLFQRSSSSSAPLARALGEADLEVAEDAAVSAAQAEESALDPHEARVSTTVRRRAAGPSTGAPLRAPAGARSLARPSGGGDPNSAEAAPAVEPGTPSEESVEVAVPRTPRPGSSVRPAGVPPVEDEPLPHAFVQETLRQARAASGFAGGVERLDSLARRSRSSGLLPELRVRGVGGLDQVQSIESDGLVISDGTQRSAVDSLLEVRLTFHLDRLVLGDEEAAVERMRGQLLRQQDELASEVLELLLDWDEVRRQLARVELEEEARVELEARRRRLAVLLDAATDGWFRGGRVLPDWLGRTSAGPPGLGAPSRRR